MSRFFLILAIAGYVLSLALALLPDLGVWRHTEGFAGMACCGLLALLCCSRTGRWIATLAMALGIVGAVQAWQYNQRMRARLVSLSQEHYPTAASPTAEAIQRGRTFLVNLLDPELNLLPEYRGANVFWLYHDNYLAAKVLAASHPQIAGQILAAIRHEGVQRSGKIELLFGEAPNPLPFHDPELKDVRRAGSRTIRTEALTDRIATGWEHYADLLLMASIAERNQPAARRHWEAAMKFWDGNGFLDAAARDSGRYATYKLALALLAARRLSPPANPPPGLLDRLLALQDESGGWITDYDESGKKIGLANVETTSLAILGLEAFDERTARPGK